MPNDANRLLLLVLLLSLFCIASANLGGGGHGTKMPPPTQQPVKFMPLTGDDAAVDAVPTGQPVKFMPLTGDDTTEQGVPVLTPTNIVDAGVTLSPTVSELLVNRNNVQSNNNQNDQLSSVEIGLMTTIAIMIVAGGVYCFYRFHKLTDTSQSEKGKCNSLVQLEEGTKRDTSLHGFAFHEVYDDCKGTLPSPSKTGGTMIYQSFWEAIPPMMTHTTTSNIAIDTNSTEADLITMEDSKPKTLSLNVPSSPQSTNNDTSSPEYHTSSQDANNNGSSPLDSLTSISFNSSSPGSDEGNGDNEQSKTAEEEKGYSFGMRSFRL